MLTALPGAAERDAALLQVDEHADALFKEKAYAAVRWIAGRCRELTTDDVWDALDRYYPHVGTREPRAMGAVMTRARRAGIVERTDRTRNSDRPENHRRPVRVWLSAQLPSGSDSGIATC